MKCTCPTCHAKYAIPDARVAGKVLKIRCKRCEGIMEVMGPTADYRPGQDARPPTLTNARAFVPDGVSAVSAPIEAPRWWCGIAGKPHGPYRDLEIKALVNRGDVHSRTYLWAKGMKGWERVSESPVLSFAYGWVVERAGEHMAAVGPRESSAVYDMAGLVSDGESYFPDPTLKSGWLVLDERTQAYLETCAKRGDLKRARRERSRVAAPLFALGVVSALSGSAWIIAQSALSLV
jgi:predicted Zn finger-like uncharacterized protein